MRNAECGSTKRERERERSTSWQCCNVDELAARSDGGERKKKNRPPPHTKKTKKKRANKNKKKSNDKKKKERNETKRNERRWGAPRPSAAANDASRRPTTTTTTTPANGWASRRPLPPYASRWNFDFSPFGAARSGKWKQIRRRRSVEEEGIPRDALSPTTTTTSSFWKPKSKIKKLQQPKIRFRSFRSRCKKKKRHFFFSTSFLATHRPRIGL